VTGPRLRLLVFGAGLFSLTAQTVLLREQLVVFGGNELGTGIFLATWLGWVGAGALGGRWWLEQRPEADRWLGSICAAWLPLAVIQLLAFQLLRPLGGVGPAELFPLERLALLSLALNAPTSFVTGLVFTLAAGREERRATARYAWEAAGCFAGGAGVTLGLLAGWSGLTLLGLGVLPLAAALAGRGRRASTEAALLGLASAALALGGGAATTALARGHLGRLLPGAELLGSVDTPHGRWVVAAREGQRVVLRDGQVAASHPDPASAPLEAALAAAQASGPARVLVVGDPAHELCVSLLAHDSVERLDRVVVDGEALAFVEPLLPAAGRRALQDPRLHTRTGDPRALLGRGTDDPWDLVVVAAADPATAASARLFSADFLRQLAPLLSADGVVATRVMSGENHLGPELARQGASALTTLRSVFDGVVVLPGDPSRFYASPGAGVVTDDGAELARRHRRFGRGSVVPAEGLASLVDPRRTAFVRDAYQQPDPAGRSLVATDARPLSSTLALLVQGRLAGSSWVRWMHGVRAAGAWTWAVPLLLLLVLGVHRLLARAEPATEQRTLAAAALGGAGLTSLAFGVMLLFALQAKAGVLFGQVGLATSTQLAGIAAGAALGRPLAARLDPTATRGGSRLPRAPMLALALQGALAASLPGLLALLPHGPAGVPGFLGLFALAGLVTGLAFPAGATLFGDDRPAGLLFAADHLGGAVGAAVVGVAVVPLLGTGGACALLMGLQGVVAAWLLARRWRELPGRFLPRWRLRVGARRRSTLWPTWGYVLAGVSATAVVLGAVTGLRLDRPKVAFDDLELFALGGASSYQESGQPFRHYRGYDADGPVHVLSASMAVRDDIEGWAGPLNLLLVLGDDGTWKRVELLGSRETPSYVRGVAPWLRELVGRRVAEPLALTRDGGDVDAVTGATVTSRAAVQTVDAVGARLAREVVGLEVAERPSEARATLTRGAFYLLLALPLGLLVVLRGPRWLRTAALVATLLTGGLALNVQLSLESLAGTLSGHPPGLASPVALLLVAGALGLSVLAGPVYCSTICPFGALQELLARLGLTRHVDRALDRRARALRYVLLAVALTGFGLTARRAWLSFDPLSRAWVRWPDGLDALLLLVVLGGCLFVFRGWCRYLCPAGALLSLGNRVALLRRWLPGRSWGRCDLGVQGVDDADCLQCNRCGPGPLPLTGPVRPPAADPGVRDRRGDSLLRAWLALVVLLIALSIAAGRPEPGIGTGGARDVDIEAIERLIEEGKLSDREAEWWDAVD